MQIRRITVAAVLVFISAAGWGVIQGQASAPESQSIGAQIVGTWKLAGIVVHHPDGTETPDRLGPNPIGYIMYDRSGHMSVQFMSTTRTADTPVSSGYTAYFGTYTIDEQEKSVTHHVEGSVSLTGAGGNPKRFVELNGDDLKLIVRGAPSADGSPGSVTTVHFTRVKQP
jgi:hypothetical protein